MFHMTSLQTIGVIGASTMVAASRKRALASVFRSRHAALADLIGLHVLLAIMEVL